MLSFLNVTRSFFRYRHLLIGLLYVLSVLGFYFLISKFPDPPGANGYFYLKQTESLGDHFEFYFKDRSPAFLLPVFFYKVLGNSLEAMRFSIAVTWSALLFGIATLTMSAISLSASRTKRVVLMAIALGSVFASATLVELALHFFKNLFAVTCFVWGSVLIYRSGELETGNWKNKSLLAGVALYFFALLSHKSAIVLIAAVACSWLLRRFQFRRVLGLTIVIVATGFIFIHQFERGPQYAEALMRSFGGPSPWWAWFTGALHGNRSVALQVVLGALAVIYYSFRRRDIAVKSRIYADAAFLFAILAFHPFQAAGPMTAAYRMILLSPVFLVPLLLLSLGGKRMMVALGSFLLIMQLSLPLMQNRPMKEFFPNWSRFDNDVMKIKGFVSAQDHLTSQHGMEFYIDYKTGIRSRAFLSEDPKQKAFRVAYLPQRRVPAGLLKDTIDQSAMAHLGTEYILISEDDWNELAANTSLGTHWRNPSTYRPAHIYE